MHRSRNFSRFLLIAISLSASLMLSLAGCSFAGSSSQSSVSAAASYCPYLPSKAFDSNNRVLVSGSAYYATRINNNLYPSDGTYWFSPKSTGYLNNSSNTANTGNFIITINTHTYSYNCSSNCSTNVINALATQINADSTVTASLDTQFGTDFPLLKVSPVTPGTVIAFDISSSSKYLNLTSSDAYYGVSMGAQPSPIRFAEVRVVDSSGSLVQCAETSSSGAYSFYLPKSSGTYTVQVTSRSNNSNNTAYVMNNPNSNSFYAITKSVSTAADSSGNNLLAPTTGSLEGGAFNILDQIAKAQAYLRTTTLGCDSTANSNHFGDCVPFTVAPVISAYWTPGLSPAVYVGGSGPISFYLTGKNQLYIGGGLNGDVNSSDGDHYDNSVIIHEYGHFIEDNFGNPDSPGGSHNGDSIIDPRLAWGEGWADFFQGAVLFGAAGTPVYKDTLGNLSCGRSQACTGTNYIAYLRKASASNDLPTDDNEGIFREFSITRMLFAVIDPSNSPITTFSEIWATLTGPTRGMRVSSDHFKSMARVHYLQSTNTYKTDWSSASSNEKQSSTQLGKYGTPLIAGSSCPVTMNSQSPYYHGGDQFYNNDFYRYVHTGGTLSITVNWVSNGATYPGADLQLVVYKAGYTYGDNSDMAMYNQNAATTTSTGSKTATAVIPAGTYLLNVVANTSSYGSEYHSTNYSLTVNGSTVCPNPAGP